MRSRIFVKATFHVRSAPKGSRSSFRPAKEGRVGASHVYHPFVRRESWEPAVTLPAGFTEEIIPGPWDEPVGLTFEPDHQTSGGRAYVWERSGRVWIVEDDVKQTPP